MCIRDRYKLAPPTVRAPWDAFATGRPFLGHNKFVGENNRLLVGQTDFTAAIMSPGARGGLPPATVVAATGVGTGEIDVTITPPADLPDGWTIVEIAAAAFPQQNPVGLFVGPFVAGVDVVPTNAITLAGFSSAANVQAFGWVVYEKPNAQLAYSVSLADEAVAGV